MSDRRAMWPIDALLGLFVFVGVSSSVSPWFADLYSAIAWPWGVGAGAIAVVVWVAREFGPDLALSREASQSWAQNGARAQELAAKHAAHPEVAKALAARMLQEKLRQQPAPTQLPPAPTQG